MHLDEKAIAELDPMFRRHFLNTLPGPRGVHLIGTKGYRGTENLAVFSSVVHFGAAPHALLGFVLRPLTVPRHTYHHIKATGWFTLNTIQPEILEAAHQASANYDIGTSEFAATGLTPQYSEGCPAPYVAESEVSIGLTFEEEHHVRANGTVMVIGRIREIFVPDDAVAETGHVDHHTIGTFAVAGLDTYHAPLEGHRLPYARP